MDDPEITSELAEITDEQNELNDDNAYSGITRPWRPQDADKEVIREAIRRRVRTSSVADNAIFYPAKPKPTINDTDDKRVAVYARVSTKSTEQVSSIENQTKYYTEKIQKTPNWTLQEIYSDEGKSGTSTKKRAAFNRMMKDARNKEMDLILCASVSRFARNVSDCIKRVKELQTANPSHPVGVYFETEDIYTLDPDSRQLLSIHALLADWESANKSRRMILSYDQRICTGQYPVLDLLGYRHTTDGDLIIQEDEAITVRFIFLAYFCGFKSDDIADILTKKKRPTLKGRTEWNTQMVREIIKNERRWGDLSARKTIVIDYTEGKTVKNNNIRDAAFVPNHHKGIVSPEIARAVHYSVSSRGFSDGVQDMIIIKHGALKGFVSVCPGWNGIDNETFMTVCRSVYDEDELNKLITESNLVCGKEKSKDIINQALGYEFPRSVYFMSRYTPTLTITSNSIELNRACFKRLGECPYIEIMYHPYLKMVIVRTSTSDNPNSLKWIKKNNSFTGKLTASAFAKAIYEKMTWAKNYRFRFRGISRDRGCGKLLLFYLDEPQILVGSREVSYPETWGNVQIGLCYELKTLRDKLANSITEQDIIEQGDVVVNPLIGVIPTREKAYEELMQLLEKM